MKTRRGRATTSVGQKATGVLAGVLAVRLGLGAVVVLSHMTAAMLRALIWTTVLVTMRPFLLVSVTHIRVPGEDPGESGK